MAQLFTAIEDKMMIPQKFKGAEIELYERLKLMLCNLSVLERKRNFCICWNNGEQTWSFGLVQEQLTQFSQQGNLRKAENKGPVYRLCQVNQSL